MVRVVTATPSPGTEGNGDGAPPALGEADGIEDPDRIASSDPTIASERDVARFEHDKLDIWLSLAVFGTLSIVGDSMALATALSRPSYRIIHPGSIVAAVLALGCAYLGVRHYFQLRRMRALRRKHPGDSRVIPPRAAANAVRVLFAMAVVNVLVMLAASGEFATNNPPLEIVVYNETPEVIEAQVSIWNAANVTVQNLSIRVGPNGSSHSGPFAVAPGEYWFRVVVDSNRSFVFQAYHDRYYSGSCVVVERAEVGYCQVVD